MKTEKLHISTVKTKPTFLMLKSSKSLDCFRRNMQVWHAARNGKCYIIKKKWISHQNTFRVPGRWLRIVFLSNEDIFSWLKLYFIHPNEKKYALASFSKFDTVPACVKTEVGRQFVVNYACYKFLALLFTMISQVNIQGVEHDLRRIEQIDSRLYNNEDTQRVIQELGSM